MPARRTLLTGIVGGLVAVGTAPSPPPPSPEPAMFCTCAQVTPAGQPWTTWIWRPRHAEERLHLKTWPDLGHVFVDRMQDEVFSRLDTVL
ncbi:hypothetical protein [Streptomyces sp. NBC_00114]|uniref:hypothetical protein n=1 Tax=Streptomyces sp. NBC_00114 TaxID=2975656 RepID=UPI0038650847